MPPGPVPTGRPEQTGATANRARRRPNLSLPLPVPLRDASSGAVPVPVPVPVPLPLPPPPPPPPLPSSSASSSAAAVAAPAAAVMAATPSFEELERVRRVGSGSGGTVWKVRHRTSGRLYALKVLHGTHDDEVRRRIRREIEILRATDDPAVVRCHAMYERAGEIEILLEYMDGGSLEGRRIASEPLLADVARQVLGGIAYLHARRIVHRDIKPSNLLVDAAARCVKIADFGVGRILARTLDPTCNSSVGTVAYMSPERINTELNEGNYDGYAGDIWSFGLSILEFYLGSFPFGEGLGMRGNWASLMCAICFADPPEAPPTASRELRSFIRSCLQKEPSRRLTAAQLLQHPFITQYYGSRATAAAFSSLSLSSSSSSSSHR